VAISWFVIKAPSNMRLLRRGVYTESVEVLLATTCDAE